MRTWSTRRLTRGARGRCRCRCRTGKFPSRSSRPTSLKGSKIQRQGRRPGLQYWVNRFPSPDRGLLPRLRRQRRHLGRPRADPVPPAYTPGSDTFLHSHLGVYPFLDHADNLHIVANIMPMIAGLGYIIPCEIWHWYQPNGMEQGSSLRMRHPQPRRQRRLQLRSCQPPTLAEG